MKAPPNKPVLDKQIKQLILNTVVNAHDNWRNSYKLVEEATQSINQLISNQISATLDLVEGALPELQQAYRNDNSATDEVNKLWGNFDREEGFNECRAQALEAIQKIREEGLKDEKRN